MLRETLPLPPTYLFRNICSTTVANQRCSGRIDMDGSAAIFRSFPLSSSLQSAVEHSANERLLVSCADYGLCIVIYHDKSLTRHALQWVSLNSLTARLPTIELYI